MLQKESVQGCLAGVGESRPRQATLSKIQYHPSLHHPASDATLLDTSLILSDDGEVPRRQPEPT